MPAANHYFGTVNLYQTLIENGAYVVTAADKAGSAAALKFTIKNNKSKRKSPEFRRVFLCKRSCPPVQA